MRLRLLFISFIITSTAYSQGTPYSVSIDYKTVRKIKEKCIIGVRFDIGESQTHPNSTKKDGDLHIGGSTTDLGFNTVAEIMNAKDVQAAIDTVHNCEVEKRPLNLVGCWRLWFEHQKADEEQDYEVEPEDENTNPDHTWEIHPVLEINGYSIANTLRPIREGLDEYEYKKAEKTIKIFSNTKCTVTYSDSSLRIQSKKLGYNYCAFTIRPTSKLKKIPGFKKNGRTYVGGHYLSANVAGKGKKNLASNIRFIFPPRTSSENKIKKLTGKSLQVVAIPRVSLSAIYHWKKSAKKKTVIEQLPIEFIVVAVLRISS